MAVQIVQDKQAPESMAALIRFEEETRQVVRLTNAGTEGRANGLRLYEKAQDTAKLQRFLRRVIVSTVFSTMAALFTVGYFCFVAAGQPVGMIVMLLLAMGSFVAAGAVWEGGTKVTREREKYIRTHGKWFDVKIKGYGSVKIKGILPYDALEEAAKRWGIDIEDLRDFSVKEASA